MTFDEHLEQLLTLLQREGRITYRAVKRRLDVDEDYLADLTAEIIDAKRVARENQKRRSGEAENRRKDTPQPLRVNLPPLVLSTRWANAAN